MNQSFLPIAINVRGCKIVFIGGGAVALQKLTNLVTFANEIEVFATQVCSPIKELPVRWHECSYTTTFLVGARLVYACTNDRELNRHIGEDARAAGALVNVADDPAACDFISPALSLHGDMAVAVTSNGCKPSQSVHWRNAISEFIQNDLLSR